MLLRFVILLLFKTLSNNNTKQPNLPLVAEEV